MNDKISINVEIPGINIEHNFLVPQKMQVSRVVLLITQMLSEEYNEVSYDKLKSHILLSADTGQALLEDASLSQLGVLNGERLILI
mgnify:CR=1 FL=1|jgi:hypothetical protein|nr:hypothetical protein [uncultured Lachnoanaerobaculum sp.]